MADWASIAAVITSLGVGGLLGSFATGRHETSEKFRDRTIESCRNWLVAHDAVRRDLAIAHDHLLRKAPTAADIDAAADALERVRSAWRELQTQTFLVSLLLAGGTSAPAAQAAQALTVCYDRWRDVLLEVRTGVIEPEAARMIIHYYVEHATVLYNEFVVKVNEAVRPWAPWRRGQRGESIGFDTIDDLDVFAKRIRAESQAR